MADQIGAPTWAKTISAERRTSLLKGLRPERWTGGLAFGIYHFTSTGATSWHGFAEAIFAAVNVEWAPTVLPIPRASTGSSKASCQSQMSHDKLAETFKVKLRLGRCASMCLSE
nr:sugar nucleotide-binding protein [Burkholderia multivorans]